jgi:hypothetical protein
MALTYESVVDGLAKRVPGFHTEYRELPHVAFGDLVSFLNSARVSGAESEFDRLLFVILAFIEDMAASGDARLADLVEVSFLENLHNLGPKCPEVLRRLGPMTAHLRTKYEASWGRIFEEDSRAVPSRTQYLP